MSVYRTIGPLVKLIRMGFPDRASILQDWTYHTFISCFLHILGAGEKSSPQETKCSIGFSANIADMRIPFQIICNCYTKVLEFIFGCNIKVVQCSGKVRNMTILILVSRR